MALIGIIIALLTRLTMSHQLQEWTEKSLRSALTARVLLLQQQLRMSRSIADSIALRIKPRDALGRYLHGHISAAQLSAICLDDLGDLPSRNQMIQGLVVLDDHLERCATIGRLPDHPIDHLDAACPAIQALLIGRLPVLRLVTPLVSSHGERLGVEAMFCSFGDESSLFSQDMGFGPALEARILTRIDGRMVDLIAVSATRDPAADSALTAALAHPQQEPVVVSGPDGTPAGIWVVIPEAGLIIDLSLDSGLLHTQRASSLGWITGVLTALVAVGSLGLMLVMVPMGRRVARQQADLDAALAELQQSDEFSRRISDSSPDGMLILSRSGSVDTINQSGLTMLQRGDMTTVIGLSWLSMWPEGDRARELAHSAMAAAQQRKLGHFTASARSRTGHMRWWDVLVAPILDGQGEVVRLLAVFRDITLQSRAEQAVMVSEQRLRTVATATNDVIWDWNLANGTVWWNESITALFGYDQREVGSHIGWWRERIHPDDRELILSAIDALIAGTLTVWRAEYRFRNANGSYTPILDRGQVIRDGTGAAQRVVAAMFNLSERRQREDFARRVGQQATLRADVSAALVASWPRRQAMQACTEALIRHLDAAFARIWILEREACTLVLDASAGAATLADQGHARIPLGQSAIGQAASGRRRLLCRDAADGDGSWPDELAWMRPAGVMDVACYPLLIGEEILGVMAIASKALLERDTIDGLSTIADLIAQGIQRDAFERDLAAHATALRLANGELEQFTYVASHDLQEPLRTIANYLDLLTFRYRGSFDDQARHYIDRSQEAAKRLQQLIKNLLIYSRIGHQQVAVDQEVSSAQVLSDTLGSLHVAITEALATITVLGELPTIRFNKLQLGQVFQNLIGNAIKYHGRSAPQVRVSATAAGGLWTFSIADNGIGIEAEYFDRIFDMFQRVHVDDVLQGTGVGLALCKKIVIAHGGTIWVESVLDQGSTFHFTVPIEPRVRR